VKNIGKQIDTLGNRDFMKSFGIRYAYYSGAMYKGIASPQLVVAMGKAGMMGFLGTGGLSIKEIRLALEEIQSQLHPDEAYGANILNNVVNPELEEELVDLYLEKGVECVEASAYMTLSKALVRYRAKGLSRDANGKIHSKNRIIAKISRPEVASVFLNPAPEIILKKLLADNKITKDEAELASLFPVANALCVESDSGGHTDQGSFLALFPAIDALRKEISNQRGYADMPFIGAGGGIGTPQAVAAAYLMGADFVCTGSINQCTIESGMSDTVKNMLQDINIQDTTYAPSGDMFEIGARVQVLKKGVLFPARANKLFELYCRYNSLADIDVKMVRQIEEKYFKRSIDDVWEETREYCSSFRPTLLAKAESSEKVKMSLIFRWYFVHTTRLTLEGNPQFKTDFQVHCGPSMGAFNQIVKGSNLEHWQQRSAAKIGIFMMENAIDVINQFYTDV